MGPAKKKKKSQFQKFLTWTTVYSREQLKGSSEGQKRWMTIVGAKSGIHTGNTFVSPQS